MHAAYLASQIIGAIAAGLAAALTQYSRSRSSRRRDEGSGQK